MLTLIQGYTFQAIAHTNEDLVGFWSRLRFKDCDALFITRIATANVFSVGTIGKQSCLNIDLGQLDKKETKDCFKALDKTIQVALEKTADLKPEGFGCKGNPNYAEFIQNNNSILKPVEKIFSADLVCVADEKDKKFLYASVDNQVFCTKKFNCNRPFSFGTATVEAGKYYLRCHLNPTSQSDCDSMSLAKCEGQEVGYVKMNYGGLTKSEPIKVQRSVGAGASAR